MYTSNSTRCTLLSLLLLVQGVIEAMMSNNVPPIPPDKVLGFNTRKEADLYLADHPDGCLGAVQFVRQGADTYSYIVTSNSTVRVRCVCVCVGGGVEGVRLTSSWCLTC
jgi:hypothetical protein